MAHGLKRSTTDSEFAGSNYVGSDIFLRFLHDERILVGNPVVIEHGKPIELKNEVQNKIYSNLAITIQCCVITAIIYKPKFER